MEVVVLLLYTWVCKINGLRIFLSISAIHSTRLESLVRTLYQEATARTGFPLRRRLKKEEKERRGKSTWGTQRYMHTKN